MGQRGVRIGSGPRPYSGGVGGGFRIGVVGFLLGVWMYGMRGMSETGDEVFTVWWNMCSDILRLDVCEVWISVARFGEAV